MKLYINPEKSAWSELLKRPTQTVEAIEATVNEVFDAVSKNGDKAIEKYTTRFDGVKLELNIVSALEIETATESVAEDLKKAIQLAKSNIETFHRAQKTDKVYTETIEGV
jgi:histidinol dehydrogenase